MSWLNDTMGASIGKKLLMAITGLGFCGFLIGHLGGNLTIYFGRDAFNGYAERLHAMGLLLTVMEMGLLLFVVVHVATGLILFLQNRLARPTGYAVSKWAGGRTIGSATMPYSGLLILAFVIFHLLNFHFVDKTDTTIFDIVTTAFTKPAYVVIYILAMLVVAMHVSHGLWSAFQTLGANHPKYTPGIMMLSLVFGLVVGFGFGFIPIFLNVSV